MWRTRAFTMLLGGMLVLPGCTLLFGDEWIDDMMTSPEFVCAIIQMNVEIEFGDLPDDAVVALIGESDDGTAWAVFLHGKEERLQYFCEACDGDLPDMGELWSHRLVQYPDLESAQRLIPQEHAEVSRILLMSERQECADRQPEG